MTHGLLPACSEESGSVLAQLIQHTKVPGTPRQIGTGSDEYDMEVHMSEERTEKQAIENASEKRPLNPWAATVPLALGLLGVGYGFYSHREMSQAVETRGSGQEQVAQMQDQIQTLRNQLTAQQERERDLVKTMAEEKERTAAAEVKAATPQVKPSPFVATAKRQAAVSRPQVKKQVAEETPRPVDDPRWGQMEKKLSEQDEKLASTQRQMEQARTDLEGRIDSTSRDLNSSIARTSDEVAQLRKRGERDYFEFDIAKSKQVQRVGPVSVALRKADTKRKRYNLDMLVEDNKLEKKNVNLYEPVYVSSPDWPQPLELVVNRVTKDRVAGYISVPKHKRSELAQASGESTAMLQHREED